MLKFALIKAVMRCFTVFALFKWVDLLVKNEVMRVYADRCCPAGPWRWHTSPLPPRPPLPQRHRRKPPAHSPPPRRGLQQAPAGGWGQQPGQTGNIVGGEQTAKFSFCNIFLCVRWERPPGEIWARSDLICPTSFKMIKIIKNMVEWCRYEGGGRKGWWGHISSAAAFSHVTKRSIRAWPQPLLSYTRTLFFHLGFMV